MRYVVGFGPVIGEEGSTLEVPCHVRCIFTPEKMLVTAETSVPPGLDFGQYAALHLPAPMEDCISVESIDVGPHRILDVRTKSSDFWESAPGFGALKEVRMGNADCIRIGLFFHRRAVWSAAIFGRVGE